MQAFELQSQYITNMDNFLSEYDAWLGKRLFAGDGQPYTYELTHSRVSPSGLIAAIYVRDGEVKTGSFAQDQPSAAELARREKPKREG